MLLALSRADPDYIIGISLLPVGRWDHSSAPTKITLIYIICEFIIFMGSLVREPERVVQGVVNDSSIS